MIWYALQATFVFHYHLLMFRWRMPMRPAMNINQISDGVRGQKVTASMTINLIIFSDQFNLCAWSVAAGE